ncbi:secreted protein [gut metagenome]|uniref:Secreted protein n=1 Tax=gut metagenome TaxID=749906 RepID=J9CAF1_9ZZZZ
MRTATRLLRVTARSIASSGALSQRASTTTGMVAVMP